VGIFSRTARTRALVPPHRGPALLGACRQPGRGTPPGTPLSRRRCRRREPTGSGRRARLRRSARRRRYAAGRGPTATPGRVGGFPACRRCWLGVIRASTSADPELRLTSRYCSVPWLRSATNAIGAGPRRWPGRGADDG